jgi:hypothetical protein
MNDKHLSNPFSTGGGGGHFEAHIQALYVILMLTGGYAPYLPCWPITEIKLQGKIDGFLTDDLIVIVEEPNSKKRCKLLGQVKHKISITQGDPILSEVMQAAWNDFNNPRVFSKGNDIIALITGPLSATDSANVQWLLSQARHTKDVEEFDRHVRQAKFSPTKSEDKLEILKKHLKASNNNQEISDEDIYSFLKHFYILGYDLGEESGVVLPLLHSHISQFNRQYPDSIWSRVVDVVQTWNQNAGTIIIDKLPNGLKDLFKQPAIINIPSDLMINQSMQDIIDWNKHQYATLLAILNSIGSWSEKNVEDINALSRIINEDYILWAPKAREILQLEDSPVSLYNGVWKVTKRRDLLNILGSRIFDQNLDALKEITVTVLTEIDPAFEMSSEERYKAGIYGKVLTYSYNFREGLAEGLALLGNSGKELVNCSIDKVDTIVSLAVREIFENADWRLWGSLNILLTLLAEAAPNEFIRAVDYALSIEPCPFDELFAQEGTGITGTNYLTGLLWALETLAWDEKYLVQVCILLGELAGHDPGGNWANRPANSLTTILLPWFPQTMASISKRKIAVQTLCRECPDVSWDIITSLLPNQHQTTMGSHKPVWMNISSENLEKDVTHSEYWDQVSFYAELAVSLAKKDIKKLICLIDQLDDLPKESFDELLKFISSENIVELSEEERLPLWEKLNRFISTHRSFFDAEWALSESLLESIEVITKKIAPVNPTIFYRYLFSDWDVYLYERTGTFEEQQKRLIEQRNKAITEIIEFGGIDSVICFSESVHFPDQVGESLGYIANTDTDKILLPAYLETESNKYLAFINGYIRRRHYINGWIWVDNLDKTSWSKEQLGQFLKGLPFTGETWNRVDQWMESLANNYWILVDVNPYQVKDDMVLAIDKLLEYERPHAAINCLNSLLHQKKPVRIDQCVNALRAALLSSEPSYMIKSHHIVELIKTLQMMQGVSQDDLFFLEWAYLPLLDSYNRATPKLLENRIANNPEFFCEVIRLIYRSKKNHDTTQELTDEVKAAASNAWRLLHNWHTLPGIQEDGSFDGEYFLLWLQRVKEICIETGHLEVAFIHTGEVLIHSPADSDGLWINHNVAKALNAKDTEALRSGFRTGAYNARGVHWIDPTGEGERKLAEQYKQKAEEVENAGYQRFAVALREMSESYYHEAERIVFEHKIENE